MIEVIFNVIGMTGTALVVGSFFMLQLEKMAPQDLGYNVMNLSGAILLLISLTYNFNLASVVIELFWIGASLIGLYKYVAARKLKASAVSES
ncbi:MAG: hypothetical protein HRU25_17130 [Psychrobium sp.]|nr:hypothetical protein [Psychrobium sp.]